LNLSTKDSNIFHSSFKTLMYAIDPVIASILNKALDSKEISIDECVELFETKGIDFYALIIVADELRRRTIGDIVTYIVNQNII